MTHTAPKTPASHMGSPEVRLCNLTGGEWPDGATNAHNHTAEIAARAKQSKMRRLDQRRVESDPTSLFGHDAQGGLF